MSHFKQKIETITDLSFLFMTQPGLPACVGQGNWDDLPAELLVID